MKLLLTLLLLPLTFALSAQEMIFAKMVSTVSAQFNSAAVTGTVIHPDGSIFVVGTYVGYAHADSMYFGKSSWPRSAYIVKYDAAGQVVKGIVPFGKGAVEPKHISLDYNGNLLILFYLYYGSIDFAGIPITVPSSGSNFLVVKLDADLQVLWHRVLPQATSLKTSINFNDMESDRLGNVLLSGKAEGEYELDGKKIGKQNSKAFLLRLNSDDGALQWTKEVTGNERSHVDGMDLVTDVDNNVYFQGVLYDKVKDNTHLVFTNKDTLRPKIEPIQKNYANFIAKYDDQGNFLTVTRLDTISSYGIGTVTDEAKGLYLYSNQLFKYDESGVLLWAKQLQHATIANIFNRKNANYILVNFQDSMVYDGKVFLGSGYQSVVLKTDLNGQIIWSASSLPWASSKNFHVSPNGNFIIGGTAQVRYLGHYLLYDDDRDFGYWALFADMQQPKLQNTIRGKLYEDANHNCLADQEQGITGVGIVAQPGPFYGLSNSTGEFELSTGVGDYVVTMMPTGGKLNKFEHPCHNNAFPIKFANSGSIDSSLLIPFKTTTCTIMTPDIYRNPMVDFCFDTSVNTITLRNLSFDTIYNAVAKVKFPISVIRPTSSKPAWSFWSPSDSTITFNLGNFAPQSVKIIEIADSVDCKVFQGPWWPNLSYPITVRLEPFNVCFPADSVYQVDTARVMLIPSVGLKELELSAHHYYVYPNPVEEVLQITNSVAKNDISELMILNVVGQPMLNRTYGYEVQFPLQVKVLDLPAGVYFLKIRTRENKVFFVKFIKS